ncbi:MAG: phage tail tape measure protein, partial [FCB group bacterium]|nr:phage tail tape measure protein [FCB group bacterium]
MSGQEVDKIVVTFVANATKYTAVVKKAQSDLEAAVSGFEKQAKKITGTSVKIGAALSATGARIKGFSSNIRNASRSMTAFVTGPLALIAGVGVKTFADFEQQMANVSTMVDDTGMHMDGFTESVREMSIEFGESTETLTAGLYDILSASIAPAKALDVLGVSAKAAKAGMTDTGVAADAITTILNSYGMSADNALDVSDALFKTVKAGKTTFGELAPNIGKVASLAAQSGVSIDEMGASLATMTRAGVKTEDAITSLSAILSTFLAPTKEAVEFASSLEGGGFELNAATLKAEGLFNVFKRISKLPPDAIAKLFPNIRAMRGVLPALGNMEGLAADLEAMGNRAGATETAYQKMTDTMAFSLGQLRQTAVAVFVSIGEVLQPVVARMTSFLKWAAKGWLALSAPVKRVVVAIAAIAAAAGPALMALAVMGSMIGSIVTAFATIFSIGLPALGIIIAVAAAVAVWGTAMSAVATAHGAVVAMLMGPGGLTNAWNMAKKAAADFYEVVRGFVFNFTENMEKIKTWLSTNWKQAIDF